MSAAIEVNGLTKVYNKRAVVDDVSFAVEEGEIFGLLGPNGAGKTTTIKMLTGLIRPTSGEIRVLGRNMAKNEIEIKRNIGHVYADMAFYNELTGPENLRFFGQFYGLSKADLKTRIDELLAFVDLADERKKRVGVYSKGMKQRLGIAKALIHNPPVLFFDEAMSEVDVEGINKLRDLIYQLRAEGRTLLITSHVLSEIDMVCDRIAILNRGDLIALEHTVALKESLQGKLFKYRLAHSEPIIDLQLAGVRKVQFVGDASVILADEHIEAALQEKFGAAQISQVDPSLEEAFLWLLEQNQRQ